MKLIDVFKNREIDYGGGRRKIRGPLAVIVSIISLVWITFHVVLSSGMVSVLPMQVKIIHLTFALSLCFLFVPPLKRFSLRGPHIIDYLLIAASLTSLGYLLFRYETLARMAGRYNSTDIVMGTIALVILFEASRRAISSGLFVLATFALAYGFFGRSFPSPFKHAGFDVEALVRHLMLTQEGVFGFVLGVSAEIIIVFIVFGALLQEVKIADFFYNVSRAIAGRTVGGPAKVAVIFSSMMGMVSGETSANVATTGAFTIPLMKRTGYKPYFAGAIETAASCGGQIMPPIMGATAFVIADNLGVPYLKVLSAALFPAILYYVGVFASVHFRAIKMGLYPDQSVEIPKFWTVMRRAYMLFPIFGIVGGLIMGYPPTMAAFWGGVSVSVFISCLHSDTRLNFEKIVNLAERAARTAMGLAVAMALVGVIVGVASLTGITMTIADKIFGLSGGYLPAALVLTMIVAIVLGMGVPTTPAYVLAAISAAPVLIRMGLPDMVAHIFVFYYAVMSALTPPVCTGAYTAAGLAGANPNLVGFTSLRLALGGFIVPMVFIKYNSILMIGDFSWLSLAFILTGTALCLVCIAAAYEGYLFSKLSGVLRILLTVVGVLLILPFWKLNIAGWLALAVIALFNRKALTQVEAVPDNVK